MEGYRLYAVIPPIIGFVGHLTNWYIRRSRRRFWSHRGGDDDRDKLAAFATLYEVLSTFVRVAAPILPFITEELYRGLVRTIDDTAPDSVHHTDYPTADESLIDTDLEAAMATIRAVVNLGRGLRKRHEIRVRQPLSTVTVVTRDVGSAAAIVSHRSLIAEELNVHAVELHEDEAGLVDLSAKADFKRLGPRLGPRTKAVAGAIAALDHDTIGRVLDGGSVDVEGETITIDDLIIQRTPRPGTVVASEGGMSVALDTGVTDELRIEGMGRELVNRLQALRREAGLAVTDRVTVGWYATDPAIRAAFDTHGDLIAGEVLATRIVESKAPSGALVNVDRAEIWLDVERATGS